MLNRKKTKGAGQNDDGELVAKNFVRVYYGVLNSYPEQLFHFYGEDSTVIVSEIGGTQSSAEETAEGREKIQTLHRNVFKDLTAKVRTALPQYTVDGGLLLLVSGSLTKQASTSNDGGEHCFTQALVLAPQKSGYYILNDTLHIMTSLVDVGTPDAMHRDRNLGHAGRFYPQFNHSASIVPPTPRQNGHHMPVPDDQPSSPSEANKSGEIKSDSDSDDSSDRPSNPPRPLSVHNIKTRVPKQYKTGQTVPGRPHEQNGTPVGVCVGVPKPPDNPTTLHNAANPMSDVRQAPVPPGHGVFIARLPFGIQAEDVERAFAVFGPVLNGAEGIQVRDGRNGCYAFVTFESTESADKAIEKGAIVGGKRVYVEARYPRKDSNNTSNNSQNFTSTAPSLPPPVQTTTLPPSTVTPVTMRLAPPMISPPLGPN